MKELSVEDGEFYQFCYLAENIHVRGVSIPFQLVTDDFEIVPDMSSFEQQSEESFVHAQVCPQSFIFFIFTKLAVTVQSGAQI